MPTTDLDPNKHREKSSEQLRIVLPLLSKHAADFGPESYALWFAYVCGDKPALMEELGVFVSQGTRLTLDQTSELHSRHLRDAEARTLETVHKSFLKLLAGISTSSTGMQDAAKQSHAAIAAIAPPTTAEEISLGSRQLAEHSQLIAASLMTFSAQLDTAQAQVNDLRDELKQVRNEARVDALTTLQNRRAFDEALKAQSAEAVAAGTSLALLIIDVDFFKRFNDDFGHVMGDAALRAVAHAIKQNVKGKDFAARYGGEEFAVLLPDTPVANAIRVADNLRLAVEAIRIRKSGSGDPVRGLTISCGVAVYRAGEALPGYVERADAALYNAKQNGRNRVVAAAA